MRIFGMTMENPASRRIMGYADQSKIKTYKGIEGEAEISFDDVFLMYRDSAQNFRPYLLMDGHMLAFKPAKPDFSRVLGKTDAIVFGSDYRKRCIFEYDFSDEEIKQLIDLGFYNKGFRVPEIFTKEMFELPVSKCNVTVIPPDESRPKDGSNPPLVIAEMDDMSLFQVNGVTSGYEDLAKYFQPATEQYTNPSYTDTYDDAAYDGVAISEEEDIREDDTDGLRGVSDEDVQLSLFESPGSELVPDVGSMEEPDVDVGEFEAVAEELPPTEEEIEDDMYSRLQDMRSRREEEKKDGTPTPPESGSSDKVGDKPTPSTSKSENEADTPETASGDIGELPKEWFDNERFGDSYNDSEDDTEFL